MIIAATELESPAVMDVLGLLILLLPGLSTPSLAVSREYRFVNELKTWSEAQSYCRENFHDLATMESEDDWLTVREMVANSGQTFVWFGLYEDVNSWRWSRDNTSLYGDGNTLGSWFNFLADNSGGRESCGYLENRTPVDGNCETALHFVCYDEPSNTFIPVTIPMSWPSAQSYCSQTYTELADLRTQQNFNAVTSLVAIGRWWFGLSRETWKWSDQSDCSFRKWEANQPDTGGDDCGCIYITNGWHDSWCDVKRSFICSVPTKKVLKVILQTDGSVDPNDPKVQEGALKQVENQLRDQDVHQHFQLRWRKQPEDKVFNKIDV